MDNIYLKTSVKQISQMIRTTRNSELKLRDHLRHQRSHHRLIDSEVTRLTGSPRNYDWHPELVAHESTRERLYKDRQGYKSLARHLNLAYAYVRGLSYAEVEQKIREFNEPDAEMVASLVAHSTGYEPCVQDLVEWLDQEDVS